MHRVLSVLQSIIRCSFAFTKHKKSCFPFIASFFTLSLCATCNILSLLLYVCITLAATSKRIKTPRGRLRRVFTLSGLFYGSAK